MSNLDKDNSRARAVLYCVLALFIVVEVFVFLIFGSRMDRKSEEIADQQGDVVSDVEQDGEVPYPEYDETEEWSDSVVYVSQVLDVTGYDANLILHEIAGVYREQYGRQFYFFNSFEPVSGTDDHYVVCSGDNAARFEIKIKRGKVTYIQNLGTGREMYES